MTKTEPFLVIEQDQEIVRFNERLRQLRALSSEHITWLAPSVEGKELFIGRRLWCNGVWQSAGGSQDRPRSGAFKSPFQSTVPLVLR